jgi:NADH-quinone oxidoreductase subunit J
METALFYVFAGVALLAAINVIVQRRVFYSAGSLIICLAAVSGLYMLLESPFIAAVQVIVYAGAIMVLFLFVIMLLDPFSAATLRDKKASLGYLGVLLGVVTLGLLLSLLGSYNPDKAPRTAATDAAAGSVAEIGRALFRDYLLPFEMTSVLILVAIIGVVVLAKRQS